MFSRAVQARRYYSFQVAPCFFSKSAVPSGRGCHMEPGEEAYWYTTVDESGNEYISAHYRIKEDLPHFEYVAPGIVCVPSSHDGSKRVPGNSYPLAGELLAVDPAAYTDLGAAQL